MNDLHIVEQGRVEACDAHGQPTGAIEHLWFHNRETEGDQVYDVYRVVRLYLLRYLPQESRHDPAFLDRMRTLLTGLYNQNRAQFDVVAVLAGMWEPEPIGVLQIYGVTGWGETLKDAERQARLGSEALLGALASFTQVVLEPLPTRYATWLQDAFQHKLHHATVVIGHPDTRLAAKGGGREGPGDQPAQAAEVGVTGQQLEMFLRAMSARKQEFIAPLIASRADPAWLTQRLYTIAGEASVAASMQTGSEAISVGIALPLSLSANLGQAVGTAFGKMRGASQGRSLSVAESRTHTVGRATTTGHTVTEGTAHTVGFATSSGRSVSDSISISTGSAESEGTAHTEGSAHSVGTAHTQGSFRSSSSSAGTSGGVSHSVVDTSSQSMGGAFNVSAQASQSVSHSEGASVSDSAGASTTATHSDTSQQGANQNAAVSANAGAGGSLGGGVVPVGVHAQGGVGVSYGGGHSQSQGVSDSLASGVSATHTEGASQGVTQGASVGSGVSTGVNWGASQTHAVGTVASSGWSYSTSSTSGTSASTTQSESDTQSLADTVSQGTSTSQSVTTGHSESSFSSATQSSSDTTSRSESWSTAYSQSEADSEGRSVSQGQSAAYSDGVSVGRSLGVTQGVGMGMGAVPSFSMSQSFQWYDDEAVQMTAMLRAYEEIFRQATLEGAYHTDFYVLTATEEGAVLADSAARQAFQGNGPLVVTPVQTRTLTPEEQGYILAHARAFTPSTRREAQGFEPYRDGTVLTPSQLAAYMAPALFEEGPAVTIKEKVPPFAFYPDMAGDFVWGYQFSVENAIAQPTPTPVRLSRARFFHTAFMADSGFGKSVAAERMAAHSTAAWQTQTVVLDFGAGWRKLLNVPELVDHVEVWQLQPGARVPFRWNPWQVGQRLHPERQLLATCEIFKNAGRMGERQLGYMRRAAEKMWREAGVLTFSSSVQDDAQWGHVQDDEWPVLEAVWRESAAPCLYSQGQTVVLRDLPPAALQALAVHRSKKTGIPRWLDILHTMHAQMKAGSTDYTSLEGLLLRLEAFTLGGMLEQYGPGDDSLTIENLGLLGEDAASGAPRWGPRWGVSILEGGAEMDDYSKSVILGLVAWHLYNDAVVRRRERINLAHDARITQIYFEEANKILTGIDTGLSDGQSHGVNTTSQFQIMWRDGRKFGIFLHLMVQSPSELPLGIISSCANIVVGKLSAAPDRDIAQAALGWSEKGFTDEDYKRFISQMAVAQAIIKLGYTMDVTQTAPMLTRPLMLTVAEPTDEEILARFRNLASQFDAFTLDEAQSVKVT